MGGIESFGFIERPTLEVLEPRVLLDAWMDELPGGPPKQDVLLPLISSVVVNGGQPQRSEIESLRIIFDEDVTVDAAGLSVWNMSVGQQVPLPSLEGVFSYDELTFAAEWDLSGVSLANGWYRATILGAAVLDGAGNPMADDYPVYFHCLLCDATGDAKVDEEDIAVWQQHYDPLGTNQNGPGEGDWDLDGKVDSADLALWQQRYNPVALDVPDASEWRISLPLREFGRSSIAFCEGQEYAPDEPCQGTVALCSMSDGEILTGQGPWGENLIPQCIAANLFYATDETGTKLYSRAEGGEWTLVNDALPEPFTYLWTLNSGNIIAASDSRPLKLYRTSDGGQTWAVVMTALTTSTTARPWSFHQAPNGTAIYVEYGCSTRYVYRSDGASDCTEWELAYDIGPDMIWHYHAVGYHSGTDRWIIACGDGAYIRMLTSTNDGQTWSIWKTADDIYMQPVRFKDYGHPTRIYIGSDTHLTLGWFDLETEQSGCFIHNWDRRISYGYCWDFLYHDGVWYAGSHESHPTGERNAVISVSRDLEHWTVYHRFDDNEWGVMRFVGVFDGKVHCMVREGYDEFAHLAFSPADVLNTPGLVLEPAATNLLDDPNCSSFESTPYSWWPMNVTYLELSDQEALHGDKSLHFGNTSGLGCAVCSAIFPLEPGQMFQGQFHIKGSGGRCYGQYSIKRNGSWVEPPELVTYIGLDPERWQEVVMPPFQAGQTDTEFRIYVIVEGGPASDVYVDMAGIQHIPTSQWQVGGTPRAADALELINYHPSTWTGVASLVVTPSALGLDASVSDLSVLTWQSGTTTADLVWSAGNQRFDLQVTDGQNQETLYTPHQYFQREAAVKIALWYDLDGCIHMAAANGQAFAEATRDGMNTGTSNAYTELADGLVSWKYGGESNAETMPMVLTDLRLYGRLLSLDETAEELNDLVSATCPLPPAGEQQALPTPPPTSMDLALANSSAIGKSCRLFPDGAPTLQGWPAREDGSPRILVGELVDSLRQAYAAGLSSPAELRQCFGHYEEVSLSVANAFTAWPGTRPAMSDRFGQNPRLDRSLLYRLQASLCPPGLEKLTAGLSGRRTTCAAIEAIIT